MEISIDNLPLDFPVIVLVLLAGLFQKKYLETINLNGAWKTLIVSALFTIIYLMLIILAGNYSKALPLKCFFSYVTATSLYELFLKKFLSKYFPDAVTRIVIVLLFSFSAGISPAKAALREPLLLSRAQQDSMELQHLTAAQTAYMQAAMPLTGLCLAVMVIALLVISMAIIWLKEDNEQLAKKHLIKHD